MAERCFGIVIEGLFLPNTAKPVAFTSAASDELLNTVQGLGALFPLTYLYAEEALLDRNGTIDNSIDPFRVRESHGSFNVRLAATDRIGGALFRKGFRSVGKLDVALDAVSTTVDLNVSLLDQAPAMIVDGFNQYNVAWVGTEAILIPIGSETSIGSGEYAGCIRGALATTAGIHKVGTYVWNKMPYWVGRRVFLFDAELNRTPRVVLRDTCRISSGFEQDKGVIIVRGNSHLSSLDQRFCNLNAYSLKPQTVNSYNLLKYATSDDFLTGVGLSGRFFTDTTGHHIRKKFRPGGLGINYDAVFIQNGEHCQYYDRRNDGLEYRSRNINALFQSKLVVQSDELQDTEINPHFLFGIINPDYESWIQDGFQGNYGYNGTPLFGTQFGRTRFFGATEDFDDLTINADYKDVYKYHPVAICAAFLLSTDNDRTNPDRFDIFHPNWSLNVPDAFSDETITEIHELIKRNPWDQIQYLCLGKDGQPIKLMDEIRNILQTYGYRLAVNNQGYLSFSKTSLLNVQERSESLSNVVTAVASEVLNFADGSENTSPRVFGKYGETPFFDGSSVELTPVEGTLPIVATLADNELSVNANTIAELAELKEQLITRSLVMDYQTPRLKIRVAADTGNDLGLGKWVNLQDLPLKNAWLFDSNGNRVATLSSATDARWVGKIIGRRYLISENAYEIELIFINGNFIRWRAPSARISGAPQTSQFRIGIEPNSVFEDIEEDISRFTVGDEISIIREDGTWITTTPLTISAIGADYLEIGTTNVTAYNVGDYYVELAYLRTSTGNGYQNTTVLSGIDRPYAFMGRTIDGKLGTAQLDADEYGG
jgi:hypothetical protein